MKKILSFVAVGMLASASVFAAIDWNAGTVENLAAGATVTVSSNPGAAAAIVDNNNEGGWQAAGASHEYTHDWAILDLGSEKTITDVEIYWQAAHCKKYSIYVSTEAIPYETVAETEYQAINADWLASHTAAGTGGNDSEADYNEDVQFAEPQNGQYILIYADEYNNYGNQYGMFIHEVRVANIQGRDEISALQLTQQGSAVAGGEAVTVTVKPVNVIGEVLELNTISDLNLTCDNEAVTIEGGENGVYSVSATAFGDFTLTATATTAGKQVSGTMTLAVGYNWAAAENVATGKTVQGRVKADAEDNNPPSNAVDGNVENFYEYNGEYGGGDGWVLVDLGDVYNLTAIGALYTDNVSSGKFMVGFAEDNASIEARIQEANGTDFVWNVTEGWTFSGQIVRTPGNINSYICPAGTVARYIVVKDADNPVGKPHLNEIYVAGTVREAAKATTIDVKVAAPGLVLNEQTTVEATVLDQYGKPFDAQAEISVTGAEYSNGTITANAKGMVTVKATAEGLEAETKFYVADENDYCLAGCEVTASEGAQENKAPVTDGGKDIKNWGADFELAPAAPAGDYTHWFTVKLAKPFDIDLIAALWEGASPADYNVYLGTTENDLQLYYTLTGHKGLENYSDRFSGKEMKNIQYIKIETTKNATNYGIKLHDLKVYGTSNVASVPTTIDLTASNNYVATNTKITLSAKVTDQFGMEMPDAEVTYSCNDASAIIEGAEFDATKKGAYTVTATCGEATADIVLNVVVDSNEKLNAQDLANTATLNGTVLENVNTFAGNAIAFKDLPTTLEFKFAQAQNFDFLEFRWEAACPSDYTVVATYSDNTTATILTVAGREFQNGVYPVDKVLNTSAANRAIGEIATANLKGVTALTLNVTGANSTMYPTMTLYGIEAYGELITSVIDGVASETNEPVDVYNLQGVKVRGNVAPADALESLPKGVYIVGGKKVVKF